MATIKNNKKAGYNYDLIEKIETGIVLTGPEVKSIKSGHISLTGSYITFDKKRQAWLINCHIGHYKPAGDADSYDPYKKRKLLLNKNEIDRLLTKTKNEGLTLIPISVYTKGTLLKMKIALARGKKKHDKRDVIKKRETDINIQRVMKSRL